MRGIAGVTWSQGNWLYLECFSERMGIVTHLTSLYPLHCVFLRYPASSGLNGLWSSMTHWHTTGSLILLFLFFSPAFYLPPPDLVLWVPWLLPPGTLYLSPPTAREAGLEDCYSLLHGWPQGACLDTIAGGHTYIA